MERSTFMSHFNRFCAKAQKALRRAGDKAEEMLDGASKAVKIKALEIRMDEQYENLGRLVYRDLHTEEDLEEEKLQVIAALDALFDELSVLKAEESAKEEAEEAKENAEEPAAAKAEEPAAETKTE
ncbi:MAG: hypothetical protein J6L87_08425 [Clostridia bacterium]|nr:hypothetical protein [Clostridia bacterium]